MTETGTALSALPVELHPVLVSRIVGCAEDEQITVVSANLQHFDWVLFTSANAVSTFFELIQSHPRKIACVGPDTAAFAESLGQSVDFVATDHRGDAFANEFIGRFGAEPLSVLLPRPEKMGSHLPEILRNAGINVSEWVLYRTESIAPDLLPSLEFNETDLFAFLSPSGVRNFCGRYTIPPAAMTFAMGPTTAAELERFGLERVCVPDRFCREGLVDAIRAFLDNETDNPEVTP